MKRLFFLALSLAAFPALAGVIEGKVIEVPDGRSLTVLSSSGSSMHRIRIAGLEAPARDGPYGGSSRENLRRLAYGKTVRVEADSIDAKGQLVGVVQILAGPKGCGDKPCVTPPDPVLGQLSAGLARIDRTHLDHYSADAQQRFALAMETARKNRLGFWRDPAYLLQANAFSRGP